MKWIELYTYLHEKANDIKNLDQDFWQNDVMVHDAETGHESQCDIYQITIGETDKHLVLVYNEEDWD